MTKPHRIRRLSLAVAVWMGWLPYAGAGREDESALLERLRRSGRLSMIGTTASERLLPLGRLAPGDPPLLAFRYLEDRRRHRFGELDLMMDDAGH